MRTSTSRLPGARGPRDNANGMRAKGGRADGPGARAADAAVCRLPEPRVRGRRSDYVFVNLWPLPSAARDLPGSLLTW